MCEVFVLRTLSVKVLLSSYFYAVACNYNGHVDSTEKNENKIVGKLD